MSQCDSSKSGDRVSFFVQNTEGPLKKKKEEVPEAVRTPDLEMVVLRTTAISRYYH